jgi:hypothetical protein
MKTLAFVVSGAIAGVGVAGDTQAPAPDRRDRIRLTPCDVPGVGGVCLLH